MINYNSKGQRLKRLRLGLALSQVEVAEQIQVSKQTLYKYENDLISNIPSDKIEGLARIYNVTPEYILGWEPNHSSKGRDILKALCKDSPKAQALIDRMQITDTGEVTITGVDAGSAQVIGHALRGVLVALTRAKTTPDGRLEAVISFDAIFPPTKDGP